MKFKGFVIVPVYSIDAHFRSNKSGDFMYNYREFGTDPIPRRPTAKDIEYYEILDPMEDMSVFMACDTIAECKYEIKDILHKMNMKSNLPSEWDKLDG